MIKLLLRKWGIIPANSTSLPKPSNFPYHLLCFEAAAVLLLSLLVYFWILKASWWLFLLLILAPDASLLAYAFGLKVGGIVYDIFHIYVTPGILIGLSLWLGMSVFLDIGLIWIAHIAQDRMRGYGLKYLDKFEGTSMHRL